MKNIKKTKNISRTAIKAALIIFASISITILTYDGLKYYSKKSKNQILTSSPVSVEGTDPQIMTNARQLTFVGARAGEGYFRQDGKKMIFQSEREAGNPFYQIYLLDLESGKTQRVSTGTGKTTCSWISPDGKKVMFSSTHLDPTFHNKVEQEYASRKSAQKNKYAWSYDETFDIFEKDLRTNKIKQLTKEKGYDAEGSYSPDGKWIVFASNRSGYTEKLSAQDEKYFKMDPSYMMDIYIMKSDGNDVKRLTDVKGYDGGPFFSPDGKRITWRHFTANGQTAEIWTMNTDGSDKKQITHMGAMSWAPYYHPSNDYIIFTSNLLGYSNFELFIVDTEGKKDPVRVSYIPDFDGLPVFSPSGNQISWTHRNQKGDSQIYIADWDDDKARALLGLPVRAPNLAELSGELKANDTKKIIKYLASDELQGRKTGSPEELQYSKAIASLFKEMGLKKVDPEGFIEPFKFNSGVSLGTKESLQIKTTEGVIKPKLSVDYTPTSFSKVGEFPEAPIAFGGYGIVAPASDKEPAYDSYGDLDVKGKWVLIFRDIPENIPNEKRIHLNMYSRLHYKALVASQRGAIGLLITNGPNSESKQKIIRLRYDGTFAMTGIPVLSISDEISEKILKSTGRSLKKWQDALDTGEVQTSPIKDASAMATVDLKAITAVGHNVIAKLEVPGAKSSILIAAHGDHLGHGEGGNSLARGDEQGKIHYGADDNASGVSGVLELAHYFSKNKKERAKLKQNLIFAIWSGEEIGLIGSTHFAKNTKEKISVNLNMDMIGRYRDQLFVQGVASAKEWKGFVEQEAQKTTVPLITQDDPYLPTDSMAFYLKEIPGVNFFTGSHPEYHTPRDVAALINYDGLERVLHVIRDFTLMAAASAKSAFTYQKVESGHSKLNGRSFRIYLGTIPDYTQDGIVGVKISGTSKASPAEKAGLKAGDVIVELSGTKIENLYDYVYCLQSIKANLATDIKVNRQGKLETLKIVPMLKE